MNWTQEQVDALRGGVVAKQSRARGIAPSDERLYDGVLYHSKSEAKYAAILGFMLRVGQIKQWWRQVRVPLIVNGVTVCTMVADFQVEHLDGARELIEVKGLETDVYKIKRKLFAACYPDRKYTVVKV